MNDVLGWMLPSLFARFKLRSISTWFLFAFRHGTCKVGYISTASLYEFSNTTTANFPDSKPSLSSNTCNTPFYLRLFVISLDRIEQIQSLAQRHHPPNYHSTRSRENCQKLSLWGTLAPERSKKKATLVSVGDPQKIFCQDDVIIILAAKVVKRAFHAIGYNLSWRLNTSSSRVVWEEKNNVLDLMCTV